MYGEWMDHTYSFWGDIIDWLPCLYENTIGGKRFKFVQMKHANCRSDFTKWDFLYIFFCKEMFLAHRLSAVSWNSMDHGQKSLSLSLSLSNSHVPKLLLWFFIQTIMYHIVTICGCHDVTCFFRNFTLSGRIVLGLHAKTCFRCCAHGFCFRECQYFTMKLK